MSSINTNAGANKRPRQAFDSRRGRQRRKTGPAAPPPPKTCCECSSEQPNYKCPKCREPYCSIACCRKHKEKDCEAKNKQAEELTEVQKSKYLPSDQLTRDPIQNSKLQRQQLEDDDLDEGWKITKPMMDEMDKSDWLRKELHDGGLRQLIHEVCSASRNVVRSGGNATSYQEETLANLQSNYPNFRIFLEKLKVMTGVLERQQVDDEDEEDLSSWLKYTRSSDDVGPLALKSLPTREALPMNPPTARSSEDDTSSSSENESSSSDSSDSSSQSEDE